MSYTLDIFQTKNYVESNKLSLKYQWLKPSGCKDIRFPEIFFLVFYLLAIYLVTKYLIYSSIY